jgi:hypothetical protein
VGEETTSYMKTIFLVDEPGTYRVYQRGLTEDDLSKPGNIIYVYVPEPYYSDSDGNKYFPEERYFIYINNDSPNPGFEPIVMPNGVNTSYYQERNPYFIITGTAPETKTVTISKSIPDGVDLQGPFEIYFKLTLPESSSHEFENDTINISGIEYRVISLSPKELTIITTMNSGDRFNIEIFDDASIRIYERQNAERINGGGLTQVIPKFKFNYGNDSSQYSVEEIGYYNRSGQFTSNGNYSSNYISTIRDIEINDKLINQDTGETFSGYLNSIEITNELYKYQEVTLRKELHSGDTNEIFYYEIYVQPNGASELVTRYNKYLVFQNELDAANSSTSLPLLNIDDYHIGNFIRFDDNNILGDTIKFRVALRDGESFTFYTASANYKIIEIFGEEDFGNYYAEIDCDHNSATTNISNEEYKITDQIVVSDSGSSPIEIIYKNYKMADINIEKTISGSGGNLNSKFDFTLQYSNPDDSYPSYTPRVLVNGNLWIDTEVDEENHIISIKNIGNHDHISLKMLSGVIFELSEDGGKYTCNAVALLDSDSIEATSGYGGCSISGNAAGASYVFNNSLEMDVPTGNKFNIIYYLLLIIIAITTFVIMGFIKRKTGGVKM